MPYKHSPESISRGSLSTTSSQIGCVAHGPQTRAPASCRAAQQQVMPDDHSESVPPLPIPNRTVKRLHADDSADCPCESRSSSGSLHRPQPHPRKVGLWRLRPRNSARPLMRCRETYPRRDLRSANRFSGRQASPSPQDPHARRACARRVSRLGASGPPRQATFEPIPPTRYALSADKKR